MYGHTEAWRVPGFTELRELGIGGSGRVVAARRDSDGAQVAIKYLSEELRSDLSFVGRFRHEARLLEITSSPHAVKFYEYVESDAGSAIIMELVDGVALRKILAEHGPTGPEAALVVLKGSLLGLAAAHASGVVHRDYKPENVIVTADGQSKLVDFGIAVRIGEDPNVAGTPSYMAPEQWTGRPAGPATDVYAATCVFFECLTGTRPFRAQSLAALARLHQTAPPPIEQVPGPLQALIERGMAKHPADRPPSAEAFLAELELIAGTAYGPGWEERGRRRLGRLAGLLAALFPLAEEVPEATTSLAETRLLRPDLTRKLGIKIAVGVGAVTVLAVLGGVLVNSFDNTELQAQSTVTTPVPSPTESFGEDPLDLPPVEEPTEEPSAEPSESPEAQPSPSASLPAPVSTGGGGTGTQDPVPTSTQKTTLPPTSKPSATKPAATPSEQAPEPELTGGPQPGGTRPSSGPTTAPAPSPAPPSQEQPRPRPRPRPTRSAPPAEPSPDPTVGDSTPSPEPPTISDDPGIR